jgi:hypothetical protein
MARKLSIVALMAALVIALVPGSASASVDGMCTGEATIKGVTYTPANDTPGNAIPIPDEDGVQVTYSGSVEFENMSHSGVAKVQVGPFSITLGKAWSGTNTEDTRGVDGQVYELDDFRDKLPIWIPGVWKVSAEHSASGGECSGFAMVKLAGSPLGSVAGLIALIGLVATGFWVVMSLVRGSVVSGAIAGLLFGLFLALALMLWSIRPLDTLTTVVLPIALAIIAGVIGSFTGRGALR